MAKKKTRQELDQFVLRLVRIGYEFTDKEWRDVVIGGGFKFPAATVKFVVMWATTLDHMEKRIAKRNEVREAILQARIARSPEPLVDYDVEAVRKELAEVDIFDY